MNRKELLKQDIKFSSVAKIKISFMVGKAVSKTLKLVSNFGGGSYTDGKTITVGTPSFVLEGTKEYKRANKLTGFVFSYMEVWMLRIALLVHEISHILFSDFKEFQKFQDWCVIEYDDIKAKLNPIGQKAFPRVVRHISAQLNNAVEDGRCEHFLVNKFPGTGKYLKFLNGTMWKMADTPSESDIVNLIMCLCYIATMGVNPQYYKKLDKELKANVRKVRKDVISITNIASPLVASKKLQRVMIKLKPYLEEKIIKEVEDAAMLELILKMLLEFADFSNRNPIERPTADLDGNSITIHIGVPFKDEDEDEDDVNNNNGNEDKPEDGNEDKPEDENEDKPEDTDEDEDENADNDDDDGQQDSNDDSDSELDNIDEINDAIKSEIDKAIEDAKIDAEKEYNAQVKKAEEEEANNHDLTESDIAEIMEGYEDEVIKGFQILDVNVNLLAPEEIRRRGRVLGKKLEEFFKAQEVYDLRGQHSGSLDKKSLHRLGVNDYRIFEKKGEPFFLDTAFAIVWDGSGSMAGDKQKQSTIACAIIEEALKYLLPLKIVNFTTSGNRVVHYNVKGFDDNNPKKNYAYSFGSSRSFDGGNKDGYSIRVVAKELMKRPESNKIMIIMSDGLPSDYNNSKLGLNDVRTVVKKARKDGIKVIPMFFGDNNFRRETLPKYKLMYEKNIINCSPENITKELVKQIKMLLMTVK